MTKEITKSIVLQQLQDRMGLREFTPAPFLFDETVVPTFDIGGELRTTELDFAEKNVTGTGGVLFFIVPKNEKWTIKRYDVVFMGAGAYTVSGVYWRKFSDATRFVYLDMTAAQTTSYHVEMIQPPVVPASSNIYINVDGYTSTQYLRLYIEYIKETIR